VTAFQAAMYQPWGSLIVSPAVTDPTFGQVVSPARLVPVVNGSYTTYGSGGSIGQQLSRRANVSATYRYEIAKLSSLDGDYRHREAALRYTHGITRNLSWRAGYSRSDVRSVGLSTLYRQHFIDAGFDYNRYLSGSRRTRAGFSSGVVAVDDRQSTHYMVTGSASLNREIGRTWNAVAVYTRNVAFFETLRAPYYYDGVTLGIGGLISRRMGMHSSVGATYGDVGAITSQRVPNKFATATGSAGLMYAFTRYLAVSADYFIYAYSADDVSQFWYGLPPRLVRHGATVSLRAWAPLIERGRRSDATR
jgi:hypothetical protein